VEGDRSNAAACWPAPGDRLDDVVWLLPRAARHNRVPQIVEPQSGQTGSSTGSMDRLRRATAGSYFSSSRAARRFDDDVERGVRGEGRDDGAQQEDRALGRRQLLQQYEECRRQGRRQVGGFLIGSANGSGAMDLDTPRESARRWADGRCTAA
jgi:hypothetical protein